MSITTRSSLSKNITDSNITLLDECSVSSIDDTIGFQTYYKEQIEKDHLEDCTENKLKFRTRWDNFRISRRKSYIKSKCVAFSERKRTHSQQSSSVKSMSFSTPIACKKIKLELNDNSINMKPTPDQDDNLYQFEIQRLIASPAHYSFQPVCQVCEIYTDNLNVIRCTGVCLRYFHRDCLKYPQENPLPPDTHFQCVDCWTNTYTCLICAKIDKITLLIHCEISDCGRLYHKTCFEKSNFAYIDIGDDSVKSCPAHHCKSCAREDRKTVDKPCTKLFQCLRCPIAFHDADLCTAAGSVELSLSNIICPLHFENSIIKMSTFKPSHPDFCFKCFKTGPKLLCRYCPSSFHTQCIGKLKKQIEKDTAFVCNDCRIHRQPRYGEIVFVKVSMFRWWPCEIIHPRNAPMNVLKMKRPDGTFPILFLGSQEYQWATRSRTIYYNVALRSSLIYDSRGSSKTDKDFTVGIERAAFMHKIFVNILLRSVPLTSITADSMSRHELLPYTEFKDTEKKTIKYRLIKDNVVVDPAKLPQPIPPSICDCIDGCQLYECANYQSQIECDKDSCPMTVRCHNRFFDNHSNKHLGVTKTNYCGFGLRTTKILAKNEFIIEYLGEIVTKTVGTLRMSVAKKNHIKDFYMMRLTTDLIIDAGPKGNLSRFMNHSCNPNCRVEKWIVNGHARLGIFADTDIDGGEELTFDYKVSGFVMDEDMFCLCNGNNCSGFLGPDRARVVNSPPKIVARLPSLIMPKKCVNIVKVEDISSTSIDINSILQTETVDSTKKPCLIIDSQNKLDPSKEPSRNAPFIGFISNTDFQKIMKRMNPMQESIPIIGEMKKESENINIESKEKVTLGPKLDPVQEFLSKLVPIKASAKKPESTNVFLNNDSQNLFEPIKTIDQFKVLCPLLVENSVVNKRRMNNSELVKILAKKPSKSLSKRTLMKDTIAKPDPFDEYLKKIKESQKKPIGRMESLRKIEPKRGSITKPVPFEEYMKTIENLKESQKKSVTKPMPNKDYRNKTIQSRELIINPAPIKELLGISDPVKDSITKLDLNEESIPDQEPTRKDAVTETIDSVATITKESIGNVYVETLSNNESSPDPILDDSSIKEDGIKESSHTESSPKKSSLNEGSPKKSSLVEGSPKKSSFTEESPKKSSLDEGSPKKSSFTEESPKKSSLIEGSPKKSSLNKGSPKKSCFIESSPKKSSLNEGSPKKSSLSLGIQIEETRAENTVINPSPNSLFTQFVDATPKKDIIYESFCFRCFDGGELVLCDKLGCTKTYHLSCIGLKKAPFGTWYCPWHFCDLCGDPSTVFCVQCPVSFCKNHCNDANILSPSVAESHLSLCHFHSQWKDCFRVVSSPGRVRTEN